MLVAGSDSTGHLGNMVRIVPSMLQLRQAVGICDALIPLRLEVVQRLVGGTFNDNGQTAGKGGRRQGKGRSGQNGLAHRFQGVHRGGYSGKEHVGFCIYSNIVDGGVSLLCIVAAKKRDISKKIGGKRSKNNENLATQSQVKSDT